MFGCPEVSAQRARQIVREIAFASRARGRFFVLLITATMIASFGLIANSTAVIIGAMLVSPLMTPIFGAALGMLRGNPRLLGRALWSEALGVVLAVAAAYLVGWPQSSFVDATPEMLSRTQPNLLDLLVAIFAGFAGAYALLDERVSPALPGVAIATAIVPPLATCGLCLSRGAWGSAGGAMLLFLANFVSILIVALITFWAGGLARSRRRTVGRAAVHLGPTVASFVAIAVILTNSLVRIVEERRLALGVSTTLERVLAEKHGADLEEVTHHRAADIVQVLATVRSHRTISPTWVSSIERALEEALLTEVDLVIRTIRSRDVCSLGASLHAVQPGLDGRLLVATPDSFEARESLATQVIREFFESEPGFELTRVEYGVSPEDKGVIVAYTNTIRRLAHNELALLEDQLRDRLDDDTLHLFVRVNSTRLRSRGGPLLVEWTNIRLAGPERAALVPVHEEAIREAVGKSSEYVPLRVHFNWADSYWRAMVEVIGGQGVTPEAVARIHAALPEETARDVELLVWRRGDFIVDEHGVYDYDTIIAPGIRQRADRLRDLFRSDASTAVPPSRVSHGEGSALGQ